MNALSLVVLASWLLALAGSVVNLLATPRLRKRLPGRFPRVSMVIPARDEERTIGRTVRAMLAQSYPELEIIVVNDRSRDRTAEILDGLRDPRLTVISGEEPPPGWLGKPWALHQGSGRASGELLLFADADVIFEPDAVLAAVAHLEARPAALLCLFPRMVMLSFWEHVVMPNLAVFVFAFVPLWAVNRTRWTYLAVGAGAGNLVVRSDYEAAGGHEALRGAVVDDVGLARLLRRRGLRTEVVRAEEYVSVRMYEGLREIVEGFTKNFFAGFGYSYVLAFITLALAPFFHIVPFFAALAGDPYAIATVLVIVLTRVIVFSSLRYPLVNAVLGHPLMVVTWCWILLRSIWFTGVRRKVLWRGRTYDASQTRFGGE